MDTDFWLRMLDKAQKAGADSTEIYVRHATNLSVEAKQQSIETLEKSTTGGYSVRVLCNGRLGFSFATDPADGESVILQAIESSRYTEPDTYNVLPSAAGFSNVEVYDPAIAQLSETDAIRSALDIEQAALDTDARITKVRKASSSFTCGETLILNTLGVTAYYRSTACSAQVMAVAEDGSESQMGWEYQGNRFLDRIDFRQIGRKSAERALNLLGAEKIASIKGSIVLDNSVAADFLGLLASSLSAESVQKKKSMLAGSVGEMVLSSRLNVIDSGLLNGMLGSRPFDDEGVGTTAKTLIDHGKLCGFLHNTYTAQKASTISTGNAVRGGHKGIPTVGITNLFIDASSSEYRSPFDSLITHIDQGMVVTETMGMHTANPISGEFSVGVSGFRVMGGKIGRPVKEAVISGTILELFRKVMLVGDDLIFYGNIGAPSLLIEGIDISG
jgi:PmbA protein